ncbi:MAG: hypothetical protein L3J35_08005 [Bacteroidales bacterium]|nr:hypothetical protein [Bacteroidales bacterium]
MMNFFKGIFRSKDEHSEPPTLKNNFEEQVSTALKKCIAEKNKEFDNISNIKKWAKDIILEIFDVPTAFWYEELSEYENIKYHENNLKISKRLVEKTDKVIEEYREQIKLSESKIKFCETLIKEYEEIIERYRNTRKNIKQIRSEENKLKLLSKHKKRIAKMKSETGDFEGMFEKTGKLDLLHDDIEKIEEDFSIKQEVTEYIANLDKEFAEDTENIDSLPIRTEIEKLTNEIKNN